MGDSLPSVTAAGEQKQGGGRKRRPSPEAALPSGPSAEDAMLGGLATQERSVGGPGQRISANEIQLVQNLVERCLQLYMNQREVVAILHQHAKVEPDFTVLVWEKLEEQNSEFFNAYHTRLRLKDQILAFNSLLEQQAVLAQKLRQQEGHFRAASAPPHLLQSLGIHPGGAAKLSSSGLMLDRTGAFLSAGDFLMEHGHGHPHAHPLAGPSPLPALGDGLAGGGGAMLSHLPRSFSLSDLSVEMSAQIAGDGDVHMALLSSMHMPGGGEHGAGALREGGKLPHTFSLSDIPSLLGGI